MLIVGFPLGAVAGARVILCPGQSANEGLPVSSARRSVYVLLQIIFRWARSKPNTTRKALVPSRWRR